MSARTSGYARNNHHSPHGIAEFPKRRYVAAEARMPTGFRVYVVRG